MNKKLSICIPTYNRENYLKENLKNIISQVRKYDIPIYISDNNSTDETESMIRKLKKEYQYIFYKKNDDNLGFDRNILKLVEMSETEYSWIFGDDDLLEKNAIETVYGKLNNTAPTLMVVNSSVYNKDFSKIIEEKRLLIREDVIYNKNERDKALIDLASYTTYVGSIIIKKSEWDKVEIKNLEECQDFVHITKIFNYILKNDEIIYVIAEPLIKIRYGNATWSSRSFKIWNFNWPNTIYKTLSYGELVKEKVSRKRTLKSLIKATLIDRAKGNYNYEGFELTIKNIKLSFLSKIILYIIAVFPAFIFNKLLIGFIKAFRIKISPILDYDLKNSYK